MYQIDQSFTRLAPAVDFSDVALNAPAGAWCLLGSPPKRLLPVHSPALINAWHERLVRGLVQPTEVETRKGHRRVQVLGDAIYDFDAQGQVHLWQWTFNESDLPGLEKLQDDTVVAKGAPYGDLWMTGYRDGALRSLLAQFPGQARLCKAYVEWVSQALLGLCWTEDEQEQVRIQVATALALDNQLLAVASQIQLSTRSRQPVRLEHYNHVLAHKRHYLQLLQEAPQFIALHALLSDELDRSMEITQSMKSLLRQRGLGAAVWRLLSREGTQWIHEFLPYFDQSRQQLHDCAIEIVQMATAFGTQALPPREVLHALMQLSGNPNQPYSHFVNNLEDLFPLCMRLGAISARADAATLELIKTQAMAIFEWASDHAGSIPNVVMRRITLKGILSKVKAQALLDQKRHESGPAWTVPYELKLRDSKVSAVILNSALAIWQEGQVMQHCAARYAGRCAEGELLMVSLRHSAHRHPLATASFVLSKKQVQVHKFSGFANQRISDEAFDLIQDCRRQLQRQHRSEAQLKTSDSQLMAA
jgi:hypothetical protein